MDISAVCAVSQNPKIVGIRPKETKRSHAMSATEQRWCGVVTPNKKRRISTKQPWLNVPGSITIHLRSRSGIDTRDNVKVGVGRGLASVRNT